MGAKLNGNAALLLAAAYLQTAYGSLAVNAMKHQKYLPSASHRDRKNILWAAKRGRAYSTHAAVK